MQAYLLAVGSSGAFAYASLHFTTLSRRVSPLWMNTFKAIVAWLCFGMASAVPGNWATVDNRVLFALFTSGAIALGLGDIFLFNAYARIGSARTIILYGFQPLFIGVAAHVVFGQEFTWLRAAAILCFTGCLLTFALEKFREHGHWEILGLSMALVGVLLDNSGLILSRWAFDHAPDMNSFQANFVRCTGALAFFLLFRSVRRVHLAKNFSTLSPRERGLAVMSSFLGTFLSLFLYLSAVRIGHLASIAALGVAGPILASGLECLHLKRWPSRYLLIALMFFGSGFALLVLI